MLQTHQNLGCPVFTALQAETVLVIIELNWTHLAVVSVMWNTHGKGGLSGEALAWNARDPGPRTENTVLESTIILLQEQGWQENSKFVG